MSEINKSSFKENTSQESFNPDKRIEKNTGYTLHENYDPDKRIKKPINYEGKHDFISQEYNNAENNIASSKNISHEKVDNNNTIPDTNDSSTDETKEAAKKESSNMDTKNGNNDANNKENTEELDKTIANYINDLKEKSDCPETIPDKPFNKTDLKKISPEENAQKREEFDNKKDELKKEWEKINGRPWPKYKQDVYSSNGKLIRKAGSDYDAHHIQPLGMGGKNEVKNITPLHAGVHYDKQGVHAPDSPYSKLDNKLGGTE